MFNEQLITELYIPKLNVFSTNSKIVGRVGGGKGRGQPQASFYLKKKSLLEPWE